MPTPKKSARRSPIARRTSKTPKALAGRDLPTPLAVRTQGVALAPALDAWMRKRLGFKLGKFASHLTRVTVRFEDLAGPTGKPSFACRIKSVIPSGQSVIVESREPDLRAAFDVSVDAHERAVRRMLERMGRTKRPRGK